MSLFVICRSDPECRADLQEVLPTLEAFGRVEQLDAHARSAKIRFEK